MTLKQILGASFVLLAASCSNEQPMPIAGDEDMSVSLTATVGGELETRAEAPVVDGHQMRYILEIRAAGETAATTRIVQTSPSFSFLLAKGAYDFLMWADYIKSDATDKADLYYDTSNLNAVVRKSDVPEANTEALDAFFAVVSKVKTSAPLEIGTVNLVRPFARINLVEKDAARLAAITKIEVDYTTEANQKFDLQADAPVTVVKGSTPVTRTILQPEEGTIATTFFFDYLFAPVDETKTENAMTVRVYTGEAEDYDLVGTVTVPAGMSYQRNKKSNLIAYYAVSETKVNMEMIDWDEAETNIDIDNIWDSTYPASDAIAIAKLGEKKDGVYEISSPDQLAAMAYLVNDATTNATYRTYSYKLTTDIDLHDKAWTPIGNLTYMFYGTFDGNGHKISGLNVSNVQYAGLFGYVNTAGLIKNLMLEGRVASANAPGQRTGSVVGYCNGTMKFCSFAGTVSANNTSDDMYVGGISGFSKLENCIGLATSILVYNVASPTSVRGLTMSPNVTHSAWLAVNSVTYGYGTNTEGSKIANLSAFLSGLSDDSDVNVGATEFKWVSKDGELALEAVSSTD
ncbi:MAG: hypothetical protein LBM61_04120 [Prevotellaceae bacterium]|jgi:hypothetical protein|nr:hypothetical protein [Prevotellaceae bacterium]